MSVEGAVLPNTKAHVPAFFAPLIDRPCVILPCRLECIVHQDVKLYLVFEFMQMDLKKYTDTVQGQVDPMLVKVLPINRTACSET